jgi:predicted dehydrogenase
MTHDQRLGVGFIGSGFITRFHIDSWQGVRDADVRGIWSPNRDHAEEAAALARKKRVGEAQAYPSIGEMVAAPGGRRRRPGRQTLGPLARKGRQPGIRAAR